MRTATRGTALAFSLGMHALLLGGFLLLARDVTTSTERVYRVALAELAPTPSQPAPYRQLPNRPHRLRSPRKSRNRNPKKRYRKSQSRFPNRT